MKSFFNHNGTDQIYRLRHGNIMQSQQHHLSLYVSRVVISVIRYTTSELAMNKHMIRMQGHPRVLSFCAFILLAFLKLKRVPFSNQMTQNDIQIGLGNDISQNKNMFKEDVAENSTKCGSLSTRESKASFKNA